jgi:hypothetical protein
MPQGLQVWDADGNLVIDTSLRILKYLTVGEAVEGVTTNIPIAPDTTSTVVGEAVSLNDGSFTPQITITSGNAAITWPSGSSGQTRDIVLLEF